MDDTSTEDGDQETVKCQDSFVLKDLVKQVAPLGGRKELCGCSSCM